MNIRLANTLFRGPLMLIAAFAAIPDASAQLIDTYAGRGPYLNPVAAPAAAINPWPIAVAPSGAVYFADHNEVYRYDPLPATVTRVAGNHTAGYSGEGGPAINAQIGTATGLALDAAGNLYIADPQFSRVHRVTPSGIITTVAGSGTYGVSGDGGQATAAQLAGPYYLHVDAGANLLIAEFGNAIRTVNLSSGVINTVANTANTFPEAVTSDPDGNIYFIVSQFGFPNSGTPPDVLYKLPPGGSPAPLATLQNCSEGLAIDGTGNLYTADYCINNVYQISGTGVVTTVAGTSSGGFSPDGTLATAARLGDPADVALDAAGTTVYVTDDTNFRVRTFTIGGTLTTIAGTNDGLGGPATGANILGNNGQLATDPSGDLYVGGFKVSPAGVISAFLATGVPGFTGDGGPAVNALVSVVSGIAADSGGNVFISDNWNNRIRKIDAAGNIKTIAGSGAFTNSGDGGPASAATLNLPGPIAVDSNGNIFVVATTAMGADVIRKIAPTGIISLYAGSYASSGFGGDGGPATAALLSNVNGIAVDRSGKLYIADTDNNRIRMVDQAGFISTVAGSGASGYSGDGGRATLAKLNSPWNVVVDGAGSLYIADSVNNRVRKVTAAGIISTIAGTGVAGLSGDGGLASAAQLNRPWNLAMDSTGVLYVTERFNNRVRRIRGGEGACPVSGKVNVRFHYSGNGSAGGWSGTTSSSCTDGSVAIGPQAMEGDLKLNPGAILKAGYDLTLPGNNKAYTASVISPSVVYRLQCVSGAAPSPATLTVTMGPGSYAITGSNWTPTDSQSSPLVYQGSVAVPNACGGGAVRLNQGGKFSATILLQ